MLLLDSSHHHAQMASLNDDADALGFDHFLNDLGDLRGQALLDLQPARKQFDQARDFAEANDPAIGNVGYVHFAEKRQAGGARTG